MKPFAVILLLFVSLSLSAQKTINQLEKELSAAESSKEKMIANYNLAEAHLSKDPEKAMDYSGKAFDYANKLKNYGLAAESAYLKAMANLRKRDDRNAEVWLKTALKYAKQAKDSDLIIKSVDQRSKLAVKKRNYRKAYEINQEAFEYFSNRGVSISALERNYDNQKVQLKKEQTQMERGKRDLENEIALLRNERNQLSRDKSQLVEKHDELILEKEDVEKQVFEKEEALATVSEAKEKAERRARRKEKQVQELNRDTLEKSYLLKEAELELKNAELEATQNKNLLMVLSFAFLFIVLLAVLFYARFKTKKNANIALEEKNKIIEEERHRSDELLLNILPANIAEELKENGKAAARKFDDATVLMADFKNFTTIAEQLTPEQLVHELDYCFRGFDYIISQHEVEKIKTIGDAYMCASGLVNRKTIPFKIVKAALEMQEFLEDYKKEKIKKGEPYFEARVGVHTGPVVAGVVGVNKFAYDIWGETVNIAARMEANCKEGEVNISNSTFQMVKYNFECQYRGKVAAKNMGEIDMYYVKKAI